MSERFRESALSALVTSKRFIVATCAAIAMVLGAMSGGASFFTPLMRQPGTQDNVGAVITANNQTSQPTSPVKDSTFTKQRAIEPRKLFPSTATPINNTATSTKKSALSTNTVVTVPVADLFLGEIQLSIGAASNTSAGTSATTGTSTGTTSSTDSTSPTTSGTTATTTDPAQTTTDLNTSTTTPPTSDPANPDSQNNQQPPVTNP